MKLLLLRIQLLWAVATAPKICDCGMGTYLEPTGEGKCIICRKPYTTEQAEAYKQWMKTL